ncbi:hypothetical protein lerEdw1_012965 [Lerista edwardsae]|nr:hypothetical protein lerEdw1_012965 [Lerista edwardsae]
MLLLLLLLFLPRVIGKALGGFCKATTHRYTDDHFEPGNHVIGAATSVRIVTYPEESFRALPQSSSRYAFQDILEALTVTKANVIVAYGDNHFLYNLQMILYVHELWKKVPIKKVWITTAQWASRFFHNEWNLKYFHGSLSMAIHTNDVPGFRSFLRTYNRYRHGDSGFLTKFWYDAFQSRTQKFSMNTESHNVCTGEEKLESLPVTVLEKSMSGQSYSIYNGVYALAHTLHAIHSSRQTTLAERHRLNLQTMQSSEVT